MMRQQNFSNNFALMEVNLLHVVQYFFIFRIRYLALSAIGLWYL